MRRALASLAEVMQAGVDVRGYFYWSLFDDEWVGGNRPTFGLVGVDRKTKTRTLKPSARWFGAMARANQLSA